MKFRFALAGIFAAIFLGGAAHAQTGNGFPLLPPVPHTGQLQNQPNVTHFWFIAAGDNRPAAAGLPQPRTPSQIFKDAQRFKPAFFLWSGDIVYGHEVHRKKLQEQYKEFFGIAQLGKVPVFNSPGNHEMDTMQRTASGKVETPDAQLQALYLEFLKFPANAPPYGAFDYGNSRFLAVDFGKSHTHAESDRWKQQWQDGDVGSWLRQSTSVRFIESGSRGQPSQSAYFCVHASPHHAGEEFVRSEPA